MSDGLVNRKTQVAETLANVKHLRGQNNVFDDSEVGRLVRSRPRTYIIPCPMS